MYANVYYRMKEFEGVWKLDKKKSTNLKETLTALGYKKMEVKAIVNTKVKINVMFNEESNILTIKTITRFKSKTQEYHINKGKLEYVDCFIECLYEEGDKVMKTHTEYKDINITVKDHKTIIYDGEKITGCIHDLVVTNNGEEYKSQLVYSKIK